MKRFFCVLLFLIFLLSGCGKEDDVIFYYRPTDYLAGTPESVLSGERRNVKGYTDDLNFLISLYLSGPLDPDLMSPFPNGTKLLSTELEPSQLTIQLHDLPQNLSDSEFSLACACLSMTCMELTDVQSVTILCGSRNITMDVSLLTLYDIPNPTETIPGGTQ